MIPGERRAWRVGLWAGIVLHFAFFLTIGMGRHWGYMSSLNDLGVFDQTVWNTLQGNFLQTTINPFGRSINWLAFHFQPILLLFVPLYALTAGVQWLAVAQAAALSGAAWPLFVLTSHIFRSERTGAMWAVIYLFNPFLLSAGAWDFHPITLAVPFISLGLLAVLKKKAGMLIFSCLLILSCKEHLGLTVAGFGALWWIRHRQWRTALAVMALGLSHTILVIRVIMPLLSPTGTPVMLGEQLGQLSRYSWLGASLTEVLQTLATQPLSVWLQVVEMGGGVYWALLMLPFFFVFPLVGLEFLLPALGDLAANTLSTNPMPRVIWAYHSVAIVPLLVAAAAVGVKRFSCRQKKLSARELTGLVLTASLMLGYFCLPAPLMGTAHLWAPNHFLNWPDHEVTAIQKVVAKNASVSAQANVGAHFSQRREIYPYPDKVGEVDIIILRLASPTTNINNFSGQAKNMRKYQATLLDGHLQMDRAEYLASTACLLANEEYGILLWHDPWLVLSKESQVWLPGVEQKITQLRGEWQVEVDEYHDALGKCMVRR
jgi:uncharacterized membrane protein